MAQQRCVTMTDCYTTRETFTKTGPRRSPRIAEHRRCNTMLAMRVRLVQVPLSTRGQRRALARMTNAVRRDFAAADCTPNGGYPLLEREEA